MIQAKHRWQAAVVALLLLAGFAAIGWRLVDLQLVQTALLRAEAQSGRKKTAIIEGRRGNILDAHGVILATSLSKKIVVADPLLLSSLDLPAPVAPAIIHKAAEVLGMDERAIWAKLNRDTHYSIIAHKIDESVFNRLTNDIAHLDFGIANLKLTTKQKSRLAEARINAIYADRKDEFLRVYPNGPMAAHVLGYVNGEHVGLDGVEKFFEARLRAYDGRRVTDRDALGEPLPIYLWENTLPHDGFDVKLTIDQYIQTVLEQELDKAMADRRPDSVVGIVMRPRTGEILAMSVRPTFDPNSPGKLFEPGRSTTAGMDVLRNRCVADIAEPGSTFKIVTVAGALNEGVVTPSDPILCSSPWFFCGVPLHDSHHYGTLSVQQIITKSSNIGAGKIGVRLGSERLYSYMRAFGFGQRTGVQLPAEVSGIVHKPKSWSAISIAHIPMGHEVAVTPLQMICAMSAIANSGKWMKPNIVNSVIDRNGKMTELFAPNEARQVISARTAQVMTDALVTVTQEGTGKKGAVAGYDVAGKTGTAQKIQDGHYVQKYYASFVGFLPARQPELCILISMDNPNDPDGKYYGGDVAAPVFRAVAEKAAKYLSIPPDHPVEEKEVAEQKNSAARRQVAANNHATQKTDRSSD